VFEAAYIRTQKKGGFPDKVNAARELMKECSVCARRCGVNRYAGEAGFCEVGEAAMVSSANAHFGEEAPLVGSRGSGTIFFTSCNLKCVFCQNYEISRLMDGREMETGDLADLMLGLQRQGCHNINFVTPSHVVPQILDAVHEAATRGLNVPLVYNTGGYDSVETLRILDGIVDIYMPDLKFMDPEICLELMNAPDYPETVRAAIREMHGQVGDLTTDDRGIAVRGLLVRHLVMPEGLAATREAMRFLAREISTNTYVNIMSQYGPCGTAHQYRSINRRITREEFAGALEIAREEGISRLDERTGLRMRFP
jgi:putative pyruvate formate lyase activating enzyme